MSETEDDVLAEKNTLQERLATVEKELYKTQVELDKLLDRQQNLTAQREQLLQQIHTEQLAPKRKWHLKFHWDDKVNTLLSSVFKLQSFRPLQREVINATLQGRNVLCLLPSGGGKSLCYQLPALIESSGLTLVVSPLLSLIHDQVLGLEAIRVHAAALTSHTPKDEANATLKSMGMEEGPRLVYVTPEKIVASKRLMARLEKVNQAGHLSRIVIDEAHCCSAWGNDFRTDYKKLGVLKQQFPKVPVIALTATATHQVCEDIKSILRIQGAETFKQSINRPNLYYEVRHKESSDLQGLAKEVSSWISTHYHSKESGIVYCLTRKDCEQFCQELNMAGISARFYHADMELELREESHSEWSSGKVQVMVATIAFGMGINKSDVRYVVHASISKSIENYYQESGRAGRDGQPARCLLFYRFSDVMRQASIICMDTNWQGNLMGITRYATSTGCKRAVLQSHFAESPTQCRGMCDACASYLECYQLVDVTSHILAVLRVLQGLVSAEKRATVIQLVDAWRSNKSGDAMAAKSARALSRDECEEIISFMVLRGFLQLDFGFTAYATNTYLKASDRGESLLSAAPSSVQPLQMEMKSSCKEKEVTLSKRIGSDSQKEQQQQEEALLQWRSETASRDLVFSESLLPDYLIFKLCSERPEDVEAVKQTLGRSTAGVLYADQVLQVLKQGFTGLVSLQGRGECSDTLNGDPSKGKRHQQEALLKQKDCLSHRSKLGQEVIVIDDGSEGDDCIGEPAVDRGNVKRTRIL